jgi:hypothetical protein
MPFQWSFQGKHQLGLRVLTCQYELPVSSLGVSAYSTKELYQFEEQAKANFRHNESNCSLFLSLRVELSCLVVSVDDRFSMCALTL